VFWWIVQHVELSSNGMGVGFELNLFELKGLFSFDMPFEYVTNAIREYKKLEMERYNKSQK